ncbi:MAG: hypothetical protein QOE29_2150 [Gaiellaceae bacterium]|nr:hypothetical protein [Gaiellaceae bacterium]
MRRLTLLAILALAALPGAASAAGCSPLSCAPVATALAGTHLLAVQSQGAASAVRVVDLADGQTRWQLPRGILAGTTLIHKQAAGLEWLDVTSGEQAATQTVGAYASWFLAGASVDGKRAVLSHVKQRPRTTAFALVGNGVRTVTLKGDWGFDALSGERLYLLRYLRGGYEVRVYDLATNRLVPKAVKNGDEGTLIKGLPWSRLGSWDGRYVFTLYIEGSGQAMIHELDLRAGIARCIDLPGAADFTSAAAYGLVLSGDGKTLWAANASYGRVAEVDVARGKVRSGFRFAGHRSESPTAPALALDAQGDLLALAAQGRTFFLDLQARRMRPGKAQATVAIAIGFAPDGRKLWSFDAKKAPTALDVPG